MSEHLSKIEVDGYVSGTLSPDKLLALDDHISTCENCRSAVNAHPVDRSAIVASLIPPVEDPHLSFERMQAYVDGPRDDVEREIADHHLQDCGLCREQLRDLEILSAELSTIVVTSASPRPKWTEIWNGLRQRHFLGFAVPAAALLLVGILFAGWYLADRRPGSEISEVTPPESNVQIVIPPDVSDIPADPGNIDTIDKTKPVVSLNDGGGKIEIDAGGKVSGLDDPQYSSIITGALTGKGIEIAPELRKLKQSSGELMGDGQTGVPFALTNPVGSIVEATQPKLQWKPLKGANTYRVDVFDEGFTKVVSSPPINGIEWRLNAPLRRGIVYRWQVTATINGEEVKSPVRPAPDARFKVLDAATANRLAEARAKHGRSHLLLGILYADAGLVADAEREFRILVQANPDSAAARRLLQKVRVAR